MYMNSVGIRDVVNLLGLVVSPRAVQEAPSFNVRCPFCEDRKYHLNINVEKDAYCCVRCRTEGGMLDLYSRVRHGVPCVTGVNGNSKALYRELMEELHRSLPAPLYHYQAADGRDRPAVIKRAADDKVNNTYSVILSHPALALTDEHRQMLRDRGLSDEAVESNGYRTLPGYDRWGSLLTPEAWEMYETEAGKHHDLLPQISRYPRERIIAGIELARFAVEKGCVLDGVPGFFRMGSVWTLKLDFSGIIIPTRNMAGEIVGLQIRNDNYAEDKGNPKYGTVSAKELPGGVTEGISRVHFPLHNAEITGDTRIILTEGPLKADVAVELFDFPVAFLAVQGVQNTKELPPLLGSLKAKGVSAIYNGLDMDKLTNVNVMKGSRNIRRIISDAGMAVKTLFWDEEYAESYYNEMKALCREHGMAVPSDSGPADCLYVEVAEMASALHDRQIPMEHGWRKETKGLDDYLSYRRTQKTT